MSIPIVDETLLIEDADGPALRGSRCRDCATTTFPTQGSCPRCTGEAMAEVALPRRGVLWSWTVQRFPPPVPPYRGPQPFEPYGVGYVLLGDVIVESRLTEADPDRLRIGSQVELALTPLEADDHGPRSTFAFAPVEGS